jgi:indolepyruvate ferredoxin oxidoreductase alpha subunit
VGLLKLGTLWPLPEEFLAAFVADKRDILIVEDTEPYVEVQLRALAQRMGWTLGIQGKQTGQLPREGALTARQIRAAIAALGGRSLPPFVGGGDHQETRPSQQGLCEGCFYVPLFEALRDALAETERGAVICADPGCSIRIHQPPFEMLHVKHCMGSAIGLALGLWLAGVDELPIALVGDSSFFHSGLNGLLSAVASDAGIIALILDNGSAALTGGQPHPGSGRDARGGRAPAAQLETVLRSCGVHHLDVIESPDYSAARRVFRNALATQGLRVVIGRGECIRASQRA